jgi:hypothetical protein
MSEVFGFRTVDGLAILEEVLCYLPKHAHAKSSTHHLRYQESERWRSSKNGNL